MAIQSSLILAAPYDKSSQELRICIFTSAWRTYTASLRSRYESVASHAGVRIHDHLLVASLKKRKTTGRAVQELLRSPAVRRGAARTGARMRRLLSSVEYKDG